MDSRVIATGVQESDDLCRALGIQASGRELISIVGGGLNSAPPKARICLLINKVESPEERARAREVAGSALSERRIDRVLVGALQPAGRVRAGAELSLGRSPWQIYQQSTEAAPTQSFSA